MASDGAGVRILTYAFETLSVFSRVISRKGNRWSIYHTRYLREGATWSQSTSWAAATKTPVFVCPRPQWANTLVFERFVLHYTLTSILHTSCYAGRAFGTAGLALH